MATIRSLLLSLLCLASAAQATAADWQTSWYAAPHASWDAGFALPTNVPADVTGSTVREVVRLSSGGPRLRVVLSNRYGTAPLAIGAAGVARTADVPGATSAIAGSRALTFSGHGAVTIAPGDEATSDPLDFSVAPLQRLTVSAWFPDPAPLTTFHWGAQQTGYVAAGNATAAPTLADDATLLHGRAFLSAVQVETRGAPRTVLAFGDSITDGNGATPDQDRRWPDRLAERLAPHGIAVANAGISGARLLAARMGEQALARFDRDVLDQPGASTVIVLMGINDIGWPGSAFAPDDAPMTAARLIAGYRALIARAYARGVKIVGATLPPFRGALHGTPFAGYYSPAKDAVRREVNAWIREGGAFDAVVDVDAVLRDPADPAQLLPAYDSGDHLHPGDAGYRAMGDAMAVGLLR